MKTLNQIYILVLESLLLESAKDTAIEKFGRTEVVQTYVNKFWDEIRYKEIDPKKKDINYWIKEGFDNFKIYVDNFKSGKMERKEAQNLTSVDNGNGKLLEVVDDYELWKVNSYKAANILGSNYKNIPTHWCISSDTEEHWENYYREYNNRFYFLISKTRHDNILENLWDKIAIKVDKDNTKKYYDLKDNEIEYKNLPKNIQNIIKKIDNKIKWWEIIYTHDELLEKNAETGNLSMVKDAIEKGANIHANEDGALRFASTNGHLEVVKYLVEHGANISAVYNYALYQASTNGHLEVVKYLVENGANIHANDDIALHLASKNGHLEVVKYLVENGANIHTSDNFAIEFAKTKEIKEYLKSIIDKKKK
jgi:ankyrin repeat protein